MLRLAESARCFQLAHATPPRHIPVDRASQSRTTRPLRSTPITGASPLLRVGPPAPRGIGTQFLTVSGRLGRSLSPPNSADSIRVRLLPFHTKAADRARVA